MARARAAAALAAAAACLGCPRGALAGKDTHQYEQSEKVVVWTDKVGPYNNPQETYKYDVLGLCELEGNDIEVEQGELSIGESLEGHEFFSSPRLDIHFGTNTQKKVKVCDM